MLDGTMRINDPYPHQNPNGRLRCVTVPITLEVADGKHELLVSLAYDADCRLRELNFVGRGKIGHGLDMMLHDLGIKISRAIQGRSPETGATIDG